MPTLKPGDPIEVLDQIEDLGVTVRLDRQTGKLRVRPVPVPDAARELLVANKPLIHAVLLGAETGHSWARCDVCGEARMMQAGRTPPCAMTPACEGHHVAEKKETTESKVDTGRTRWRRRPRTRRSASRSTSLSSRASTPEPSSTRWRCRSWTDPSTRSRRRRGTGTASLIITLLVMVRCGTPTRTTSAAICTRITRARCTGPGVSDLPRAQRRDVSGGRLTVRRPRSVFGSLKHGCPAASTMSVRSTRHRPTVRSSASQVARPVRRAGRPWSRRKPRVVGSIARTPSPLRQHGANPTNKVQSRNGSSSTVGGSQG